MIRRKRSIRASGLRTVMLGGAAFALAACEEERVDLTYFESPDQCERFAGEASDFSVADCETAFAEARAAHARAAPRYDSLALCEEQHGDGVCGAEQAVLAESAEADALPSDPAEEEVRQAGGSIFMPLMMGYMMGNLMGQAGRGYHGRPLYSAAGKAGLYTATGRSLGALSPGAALRGDPALLRSTRAAAPPKPLTRAAISSRGGFGAARTVSGFRGFGG